MDRDLLEVFLKTVGIPYRVMTTRDGGTAIFIDDDNGDPRNHSYIGYTMEFQFSDKGKLVSYQAVE